jgi:hypothetical protein
MSKTITHSSNVVMDVLPWPNGYGFSGAETWWKHTLSQSERDRLDDMLTLALLDSSVCEQLVVKRDPALLTAFGLSPHTQHWLGAIKAVSLEDLARAVLAVINSDLAQNTPEAA